MAKNAGVRAIAKEEKRLEKERKRQVELANKMLIPVSKKTTETLGIISFDPSGVFRLLENRWMRVFKVSGDIKALASITPKLSGRIRIVWHLGEDGGRDTCHLLLMENGEIYEEVRQLMSKDEDLIKEIVRITSLNVDEVMNYISGEFGQNIRFSYASYVRGNKDWKKECFLEINEEAEKFTVGRLYGEAFYALSYPSILKEGFIETLRSLGCQMYVSLDVNSLTTEEQLDFNRAIEKRYNKRLSQVADSDYVNVSLALGYIQPDDIKVTLATIMLALINDEEVSEQDGILHHSEGVDLLPANIELSALEVSLVNAIARESIMKEYVNMVRSMYDYIIIDCMPSLGMMTINALTAADSVLIPVQTAYLPVKGLQQLIATIMKVKRQLNRKLTIEGIVMTMVDFRTNYARDIFEKVHKTYSDSVGTFETYIPISVKAAETSAEGVSIFEHCGSGKVAVAYESLTNEFLEINGED